MARQSVSVNVNNATQRLVEFGAGAKVRLERAATENGVYTELSTQTIVAATDQYVFTDTTGATTDWYRARLSTATPTVAGDYSGYGDTFQASAALAYATVDDLREMLPDSPPADRNNYLSDLLVRASQVITDRCGRNFYRNPQSSGTEARTVRTSNGSILIVPDGIASLTTVEYRSGFSDTWTTLGAENTDWYLDNQVGSDGPYFTLRLPNTGSLTGWYRGPRLARLTGVFGWATVPTIIESGTLALAREMYNLQPTGRGSASGGAGLGSIGGPELLPRATYEAINWGSNLIGHLYT